MGNMTGIIPTVDQIEALHRKLAPSDAAYDLIHTHCVIVAQITRQLIHRRNALFMRRCTLPADAPERTGEAAQGAFTVPATDGVTGGVIPPRYLDAGQAVLGALLHDIGTYRVLKNDGSNGEPLTFDGPHYVQHGLIGYDLLLNEGYDESIAQYARNHTGVGLTRDAVIRQGLPLPPDDYVPVNLEQEVVMVADKYHSKSVPPKFLTADAYARKAARFGEDNKEQWLDLVRTYGEPDVPALAEEYHMRLVD
ncbi:HD superfamily hydrolase [Bifidobacterium pseudolongum subsp. pseudolongum]|uniref:HD superfamily hydrolase n=2 Tax=Bifidobacterium pseudolongum TaxID=1694 RepID=A0A4Q5A6B2_9BIFI|nr:HD superfamily hydrolase [Bifidobacterium pseudolongum subsp. pseudolongum]PKU99837.1 HD superfamily hydrolase [Bifidobacterium pseudolongum subsp. pseudolongum]PKV06929.1 HD superfamily hydrolase [Bifidobacterium pseudolongum subsp. pseudolongum]RYQ19223.1 HD superfamily hydrolase [Bifidobacterium pseudolongum subsp. pseudolongum]RYQ51390.1 HD superfamily hydrolase [Bifidobacterium pseudolongum subsp. pseudolongum]